MIWNIRKRKTTIQNNKKKKESNSNKDSVRSLWENFKQSNIHIREVPDRNKNRKAAKLKRQRNMAQMKEQNKIPEKELNEMETANLSDAEFKALVIRMLEERIKYGNKVKEEMKATLSEIKKNPQGTNSEGKEAGVQINDLEYKEEVSIHPEQQKETRIQKKQG